MYFHSLNFIRTEVINKKWLMLKSQKKKNRFKEIRFFENSLGFRLWIAGFY